MRSKISSSGLIEIALQIVLAEAALVRDRYGERFAAIKNYCGFDVIPINSSDFMEWIMRRVRTNSGHRLPKSVLPELISELQSQAGDPSIATFDMYVRTAPGPSGSIFLDLGDHHRNVIKVSPNGWEPVTDLVDQPLFLRPPGLDAFPSLATGAGNIEALRNFVNLESEDDWKVLLVYILYSLRPYGPYVALQVTGSAGSSKTTFCRLLRSLIDPSTVPIQSLSKSEHELAITATNSHLLVFDNVRNITHDMSDALCRLSTGGGLRMRMLYTNSKEIFFDIKRPFILNGINDLANQPDLLSRCIHFDLPAIKGPTRRTEADFWEGFNKAYSEIFIGLLDLLAKTLQTHLQLPTQSVNTRMADFQQWGRAVEQAAGWPLGSFDKAYHRNLRKSMWDAIADNPLANAIVEYVSSVEIGIEIKGSPSEILSDLAEHVQVSVLRNKALWPQTPHAFGKRLRKLEPALASCGIGVKHDRSEAREITLYRIK